jgi:BCD family chlorophyll transporter-like MFS transporter
MIFGFAVTAPLAGHFLDPFSQTRLIEVTASVCAVAFLVALAAVLGLESSVSRQALAATMGAKPNFRHAFAEVWREPAARQFTIFIFVSMLAYSAQELLVGPFAGLVFGMPPGATTTLAGVQHGGVLLGMVGVAFAASAVGGPRLGSLRMWVGIVVVDVARRFVATPLTAYDAAFVAEALLFLVAAVLARTISRRRPDSDSPRIAVGAATSMATGV